MQKKAVVLLSGGLDSILALKLMIDEGIEVFSLNFSSIFCRRNRRGCDEASSAARKLGVGLKIMEKGHEYLEIVKNPSHGYGKNMNPCIDCRIFMFKKAKEYMKEIGASFLVTGEVLGQRPMSQRREAINLIEKEADVKGLVLRPLSAKFFPETEMEKSGLVDSKKLPAISGRSRKEQIKLAEEKNIKDYPCPAGGCLLTDPEFSKRLKESFKHGENSLKEIMLLKIGRHFRLNNGVKIIVGRNEKDNEQLENMHGDGEYLLQVEIIPGPIVLLKSDCDEMTLKTAAGICASYSDFDPPQVNEQASVLVRKKDGKSDIIKVNRVDMLTINELMI
ncbi:MAG: 7-cyano-7-deazaguanine synthase [bacterium]